MASSSGVHAANAWLIVVVVLLSIAAIVLLVLYFTKTCPPCPPRPVPTLPPAPIPVRTLPPAPIPVQDQFGQAVFGQTMLPPLPGPPNTLTRPPVTMTLPPITLTQPGAPFTYGTQRLYAQQLLGSQTKSFLSKMSGVTNVPTLYSLTTAPTSHPVSVASSRNDPLVLRIAGEDAMYYAYADPSVDPVVTYQHRSSHGGEERLVVLAPALAMLKPLALSLNQNGTLSDASMSRYVVHHQGPTEFSIADVGATPIAAAVFQNPSSTSTIVRRSLPIYHAVAMEQPFGLLYGNEKVPVTDIPEDNVLPGNTPCFASFLGYLRQNHPAVYARFVQQSGFLGGNSAVQTDRVMKTEPDGSVYASDDADCFGSAERSYLTELPIACGSSVNEQVAFTDIGGRGLSLKLFADEQGNHYVGDRTGTRFLYANPRRDVYAGTQFLLQPPNSSMAPAVFRVVPLDQLQPSDHIAHGGRKEAHGGRNWPANDALVRNVGRKMKGRHVKKHRR